MSELYKIVTAKLRYFYFLLNRRGSIGSVFFFFIHFIRLLFALQNWYKGKITKREMKGKTKNKTKQKKKASITVVLLALQLAVKSNE